MIDIQMLEHLAAKSSEGPWDVEPFDYGDGRFLDAHGNHIILTHVINSSDTTTNAKLVLFLIKNLDEIVKCVKKAQEKNV